jgi:uncharacterized protein (TIGR02271 family)
MTSQHPQERLSNRHVVAGLFHVPGQAERAVRELRTAGFDADDIGLATRDPAEREELDRETGITPRERAESIAQGGSRAGMLDKIASWFKTERSDDLTDAFTRQGFSEAEAQYLDQGFQRGLILLTVRADGRTEEALAILRTSGADLGPAATMPGATEAPARGAAARAGTPPPAVAAALADLTEAQRLALREEHLRIVKEQVPAGEVRVRKEVITEQQRIDVPVTREEVVIERHPVTGEAARAGDVSDLREGEEIRVPLTEEQVRVEKEQVVKEELTVGKRKVQETEHVQDAVRREEARVDTTGTVRPVDQRTVGSWTGKERRRRAEPSYRGAERRVTPA